MKKPVKYLKTQKETIKMAKYFAKKDLSKTEEVLGWIGFLIIYGTGTVFGLYMIYQMITY
ncbi:MAG: hypothetical protein JKX76_08615 [Colwellia sp.]|nr:hypothetical protein [Colwellia sp.]